MFTAVHDVAYGAYSAGRSSMRSTDGHPVVGPSLSAGQPAKPTEPAADINQNVRSELLRLQLAACRLAPRPALITLLQDGLDRGFWDETGRPMTSIEPLSAPGSLGHNGMADEHHAGPPPPLPLNQCLPSAAPLLSDQCLPSAASPPSDQCLPSAASPPSDQRLPPAPSLLSDLCLPSAAPLLIDQCLPSATPLLSDQCLPPVPSLLSDLCLPSTAPLPSNQCLPPAPSLLSDLCLPSAAPLLTNQCVPSAAALLSDHCPPSAAPLLSNHCLADTSFDGNTGEPCRLESAVDGSSSDGESLSQIAQCLAISMGSGESSEGDQLAASDAPTRLASVELNTEQSTASTVVNALYRCDGTASPVAAKVSPPAVAAASAVSEEYTPDTSAVCRNGQSLSLAVAGDQDTPLTGGVAAEQDGTEAADGAVAEARTGTAAEERTEVVDDAEDDAGAVGALDGVVQIRSPQSPLKTSIADHENVAAKELCSVMPELDSPRLLGISAALEGNSQSCETTPVSDRRHGMSQATDEDDSSIDTLSILELRTPGNQMKCKDEGGCLEATSTTAELDEEGGSQSTSQASSGKWHSSHDVSQSDESVTAIHICDKLPGESGVKLSVQARSRGSPPEDGEIVDVSPDDGPGSPELTFVQYVSVQDAAMAAGAVPEPRPSLEPVLSASESEERTSCRGRGRGRGGSGSRQRLPVSPAATTQRVDDGQSVPRGRRGRPKKESATVHETSPAQKSPSVSRAATKAEAGEQQEALIVPTIGERLFLRKRTLSDRSSPVHKRPALEPDNSVPLTPCRVSVEALTRNSAKKLCRRHGLKIGRSVKKCLKLNKLFSRAKDRVKNVLAVKSGQSVSTGGENEGKTASGTKGDPVHRGDSDVKQKPSESNSTERSGESGDEGLTAPGPSPAAAAYAIPCHAPSQVGSLSHLTPGNAECHSSVPDAIRDGVSLSACSETAKSEAVHRSSGSATSIPLGESNITSGKLAKVARQNSDTKGAKCIRKRIEAPSPDKSIASRGNRSYPKSTSLGSSKPADQQKTKPLRR